MDHAAAREADCLKAICKPPLAEKYLPPFFFNTYLCRISLNSDFNFSVTASFFLSCLLPRRIRCAQIFNLLLNLLHLNRN